MRWLAVLFLLVVGLAGCGQAASKEAVPTAAVDVEIPSAGDDFGGSLDPYFDGFRGAFVLRDLNTGETHRYHPEHCAERSLPASTFKILNALISLETGAAVDENEMIAWDGTVYPVDGWNHDHTLKTAMQASVVWYYQELARRVGLQDMQRLVSAADYGSREITTSVDTFWLDGGITISPDEQVDFLERLYQSDLPFSERSMRIVQDVLVLEEADSYTLSGKTGSGQMGDDRTGWFVGYLETGGKDYAFATRIQGNGEDTHGPRAKEITLAVLRGLGDLP
jgi:beta-lactamase class D